MSELNKTDQALLQRVKAKIQQLAGISHEADLTQKDIDFLLYYIQEKTGETLSLTTVKRIWKNDYQRLPHLSTLNMLAQLSFEKDWHVLKKEFVEEQNNEKLRAAAHVSANELRGNVAAHLTVRGPMRKILSAATIGTLLTVCVTATAFYISNRQRKKFDRIKFSAIATADLRIPNSVVFSYDVSSVKADHFYIQQSWDANRKVEISATNKKQTDIYYEPGYHYAKLLVNDEIAKEIPVHIQYDDWYVRFRYPDSELVKVAEADLNRHGYLGLTEDYVASRFHPRSDRFQLGYLLSKDFKSRADDFRISASVKFDSAYAPACPMISLLIKGDRDYAWITMGNIGCESNLGMKVGNARIDGKSNDLSPLGFNVFAWHKIQMTLSKGTFQLLINDKVVQDGSYSNTLGDLKEVDFFFDGIGKINDIRIDDDENRSLLSQRY